MSFDTLAPHYGWMETLLAGTRLQTCRAAFLDHVPHCRNVLILGEGNGRFLLECRRRLPAARITVIDSSRAMLNRAADRLRRHGVGSHGVELICADARNWPAGQARFDLVVTHFFLDCFDKTELIPLVAKIARSATPASFWLLADFRVPPHYLSGLRALLIHRLMYAFFRLTTRISASRVVSPDEPLQAHGFFRRAARECEWGLLTSELWAR